MDNEVNPFSSMIAAFNPAYFYGRSLELGNMLPGISAPEPSSFSFIGARKIGKTALLKYLAHPEGAIRSHEQRLYPDYARGGNGRLFFLYASMREFQKGDNLFALLLERLTSERAKALPEEREPLEGGAKTESGEPAALLLDQIKQLAERRIRVVMLLDDFDPVVETIEVADDSRLRSLTRFAPFIFMSQKMLSALHPSLKEVSPLLNSLIPQVVSLLDEPSARRLLSEPAAAAGRPFAAEQIELLLQLAGRHPLLLTLAGERLFELQLRQAIPADAPLNRDAGADHLRDQFALNLARHPYVAKVLETLWNGTTPAERQVLYALASGEPSSLAAGRQELDSLANQSLIYEDFREGGYRIFGALFADLVQRQYKPEPGEERVVTVSRGRIEQLAETLPPLDRKLLLYLVGRANQLSRVDELLNEIWGDPNASKQALEVAIYRLRTALARLDDSWEYIKTERGKGYTFVLRPAQERR